MRIGVTAALVAATLGLGAQACNPDANASPTPVPAEEGVLTTIAGPIEAGSGGIVVDSTGRVYTADFGTSLGGGSPGTRIHRVDPATGDVGVFAEGLNGASGNAIGPDGTLYQSNIAGNTVSSIAPDGTVSTFATGLVNPVGIAVDGSDLVVANCGNGSLARVDPEGTVTPFVTSNLLQCPNGIVRTPDGDSYVANFSNGDVVKVTAAGEVSRFVTIPGANNGHITFGNGVLYVVARSAHQLYEVSLEGEITLLAGSGERGIDDGPALSGTLSFPNDLGLSPDGTRLYFNDVSPDAGGPQNLSPVYVRMLELR